MSHISIVVARVSLIALLSAIAHAEPVPLEARFDALLQPYVETHNFSGSVLIAKGGQILYSKGHGHADLERASPNRPETAYRLASISRVFTSAAIVLLEQQGKLALDDPLSKHLPGWPRGDEITIHHLLTLSAGFPNINSLIGYSLWSRSPQTPESLVARFRELPLEFEPGSRTVHSNSNYNVLALLIEKLSGKSYGEFLNDELLVPLKMRRTGHGGATDRPISYLALGYTPVGLGELEPARIIDWTVKTGNGSLYSTTEDLYRFDRMLVNASLLNEKSVGKLFTEHFPRNGYGWFIVERDDFTEILINGRSPGYGGYWGRAVEDDVTVILLGNLYSSATTPIGRELMALTRGVSVEPRPIRRDPPPRALLEELVGAYRFGPDFYRPNGTVRFHIEDGHLFNRDAWIIPAGGLKFIHRVYWSDLEFQRDASGKVVSLQYDDYVGIKQ